MSTLQNLDVHGTFDVHRGKLIKPFIINALANKKPEFIALVSADSSDALDRYRFDLYRISRSKHALAPIAERLFISGGSSAACHQEGTQ